MDAARETPMSEEMETFESSWDIPTQEEAETTQARKYVSEFFGGLRAERLGPKLYELYRGPKYMPELLTSKPCVLVGGRGTGKTTVLRILSYEGQYALARTSDEMQISGWSTFGMYWRLDTNQLTAFQGQGLDESEWIPAYSCTM